MPRVQSRAPGSDTSAPTRGRNLAARKPPPRARDAPHQCSTAGPQPRCAQASFAPGASTAELLPPLPFHVVSLPPPPALHRGAATLSRASLHHRGRKRLCPPLLLPSPAPLPSRHHECFTAGLEPRRASHHRPTTPPASHCRPANPPRKPLRPVRSALGLLHRALGRKEMLTSGDACE
jgi:hypothetical protein